MGLVLDVQAQPLKHPLLCKLIRHEGLHLEYMETIYDNNGDNNTG